MLPFSSKQLVTTLFTHINNNFFSVLLGRFYGMRPTGFYTQGSKWTTMGNSTITGMISSVGQPVLRETRDDPERLRGVFSKMMRFTALRFCLSECCMPTCSTVSGAPTYICGTPSASD